jgi:hypothetical protein
MARRPACTEAYRAMRRHMLLAASLLALALPGQAFARGGDYGFQGGTQAQQAQVRQALDASAFDWGVIPARVTVHIGDVGISHAQPGHVYLDGQLLQAGRFSWATVQDEFAHQVDFFLLDDATRTQLTRTLGARDWCYGVEGLAHSEYGCERFASTLVWAFWPSKDNAYRPANPNDESAAMAPARFRALVSGLLRR